MREKQRRWLRAVRFWGRGYLGRIRGAIEGQEREARSWSGAVRAMVGPVCEGEVRWLAGVVDRLIRNSHTSEADQDGPVTCADRRSDYLKATVVPVECPDRVGYVEEKKRERCFARESAEGRHALVERSS